MRSKDDFAGNIAERTDHKVRKLFDGRNMGISRHKKGSSILKIRRFTKHYGGIHALDGCTFEIRPNIITAIIGPNGSGKTTLFDAITRIIPVDKGKAMLDGKDLTAMDDYDIARSGVSRTFQQVRLFRNLTIRDHMMIALGNDDEKMFRSIWRNIFKGGKNDKGNDDMSRIRSVLGTVGLEKHLDTYASDLSYGQRKLLDLAVALVKPHNILLLDEPVAGVNPLLRREIAGVIRKLRRDGETIVIIEHDMNFIMGLSEDIIVMESGKVIARGKPRQIQKDRRVLDAYLGG